MVLSERQTTALIALALLGLAVLGNALSVTLFNSISFIFGSIAAFVALRVLGLGWGVLVAAVGASYTIFAWGHGYAAAIFTAEILVVGLLMRRTDNLAIADAVFWIGGVFLVLLAYSGMLGLPTGAGAYIALKQAINGVFNAVVAGMLLMLLRRVSGTFRGRLSKISANTLLFYMIAFVAILSTAALVVTESRSLYRQSLDRMTGVMSVVAGQALLGARAGIDAADLAASSLGPILTTEELDFDPRTDLAIALVGDRGAITPLVGEIISIRPDGATEQVAEDLSLWSPEGDLPEMVRARASRYVYTLPASGVAGADEVRVELSAAPVIDALEAAGRRKLLLLFITTAFALIAAHVMIRWLTSPLTQLAAHSAGLAGAILSGRERVTLSKSDVLEYDALARAMEEMAGSLATNFRAKEDLAASLEARVAQRTAQLDLMSQVAQQTAEGVVLTDRDGCVTWVNAAFEALSGYALAEMVGEKPGDILQREPPPPEVRARMREGIASGAGFDVELLNHARDGTPYWVNIRCSPLLDTSGFQTGFMAIQTDVTERRAVGEALARTIERLGLATDVANLGVWSFDRRTGAIDWNRRNHDLHGLTEDGEDDLMAAWLARIVEPDRERVRQIFANGFRGETGGLAFEYRYDHPEHGTRILVATTRGTDGEDDPREMIGITRDVTDERRAGDRLMEAAEHTAAILDNVIDGVIAIDSEGRITSYNRAAERMFGYEAREVIGADLGMLMGDEHRDRHRGYIKAFLETRRTRVIGAVSEFSARRRDGEIFPIQLAVSHVSRDDSPFFIGIVRDITRQKELEDQLRQAQKLEAVGQLTGGIAHDFNNLLTLIIGYSELLVDALERSPELRQQAEKTLLAAERGADLTDRLLSFSRRQSLAPSRVCADALISDMESLLQRSIGEMITIDLALDTAGWRIEIDGTQLEAALLNLCLNARDAMEGEGEITIRTRAGPVSDLQVPGQPDLPPGDYLSIVVSDQGCGMPEQIRQRVFEPFFTTKEVGKGSGLGLSMVFGFVKQSGGHISIHSVPGEGTQVALVFPCMRQQEETAA